MVEAFLRDLAAADPAWSVIVLRYFNPTGAHESGLMGENPRGVASNLMPALCRVAAGKEHWLPIFGSDYPTADGTCIRDYIHVMDLARGHIRALETLSRKKGWEAYNLGMGKGYSVLQVVQAFEAAADVKVPCRMAPRRPGDVGVSYTDASKALRELGWQAQFPLETMCRHAWNWYRHCAGTGFQSDRQNEEKA